MGGRFVSRVVSLAPGDERPYDADEWRDAMVTIERGEIELECHYGGRRRFAAGAILWMGGLGLRTIHSTGEECAVLVAVSRVR